MQGVVYRRENGNRSILLGYYALEAYKTLL